MQEYYHRLISGEDSLEAGRPNREFHQAILRFLGQYRATNPLHVYFLELYPIEEVRHLGVLRKREEKERESAWSLFYRGELDDACERLFTALHLQAHSVRIRAYTIEENLARLGRDLKERFPQADGRRVLTWISDLYASPIVHFDAAGMDMEEIKQAEPYTHLTHVDIIRGFLLPRPKPVNFDVLPRYFVENIVEEEYRDSVPNSVDRFGLCRRVSSQLGPGDVKVLAKDAGNRQRFLESLDEIRVSKVEVPKNIGGAVMKRFGLKPGPEIGECITFVKSAIAAGALPTSSSVEECLEFLRTNSSVTIGDSR